MFKLRVCYIAAVFYLDLETMFRYLLSRVLSCLFQTVALDALTMTEILKTGYLVFSLFVQ